MIEKRRGPGALHVPRGHGTRPAWAALAPAALALAALAAGCVPMLTAPRGQTIEVPGGVLLREKYPDGLSQRYEMTLSFKITGDEPATEEIHSILYREIRGKTGEAYTNLYLRRRDLERRKSVRTRAGHVQEDTSPLDVQPVLSPVENRVRDERTGAFYYPCDDRRRFAFSEERPFHQLFYDSVGYFFPVLPKDPVGVGDSWSGGALQVIVGYKFYFNNDFPLRSRHVLRGFQRIGGRTVAVIDYSYDGRFDSAEHPDRFSDEWRSAGRVLHEVEGSGTALFDVDAGCILWKSDSALVTETREFTRSKTVTAGSAKRTVTDTEKVASKYDVKITQRLMAPGERLPGTSPANVSP